MMAAEAGAEDGGSVSSAGTAAAAEPGHCRGKAPGPQGPFTPCSGSGGDSPGAGPAVCSSLGLLALGSAGAPPPPSEPGTAAFPPLPPPPPLPPAGGLAAVDEGDSLDGPEYEEEEVAIPLNAPPTNQ